MTPSTANLPRLVYIGDVPVESSYHGSALIYRLLQNYPPERLLVLEGNMRRSSPERRLPGVTYRTIRIGWARPLYTRFSRWAVLAYSALARFRTQAVASALNGFQPEAVLGIAHDYLWSTAARFARQAKLPLHLLCHDDWATLAPVPAHFGSMIHHEFARTYVGAASRLCISRYMAEEYYRRYGVHGIVLPPSRAADTPCFETAPERTAPPAAALAIAFAGTVNSTAGVRALEQLAQALGQVGGRLILYGPDLGPASLALDPGNATIEFRGWIAASDLLRQLRTAADALFVPLSFSAPDCTYAALSFPSKLADYTATGLPLLIYGPDYSSAVRWARDRAQLAEIVTEERIEMLVNALQRLKDSTHRRRLGESALAAGAREFSHTQAQEILVRHLIASHNHRAAV